MEEEATSKDGSGEHSGEGTEREGRRERGTDSFSFEWTGVSQFQAGAETNERASE